MPSEWRPSSLPCYGLALALAACGPSAQTLDDGPVVASSEGSSDAAPAEDEPEPPAVEDTGDGTADDGDTENGDTDGGSAPTNFIEAPDGGSASYQCDVWANDCPSGEKCNWWANDGGTSWNGTRCVPIVEDPDDVGEPCTVVDSGVSGLDTCVPAAMCWSVDSETNVGTCVAFCTGSENNPTCADPNSHCVGRGPMLCMPQCCPLEQNCSEGEGCYPANEAFLCAPDAGGESGAFGDPCEYINVCDPGLFCAGADMVPDCEGPAGCCAPYCLVGSPECAASHPGMDCVPWFDEGQAPPGFEHTGACVLEG